MEIKREYNSFPPVTITFTDPIELVILTGLIGISSSSIRSEIAANLLKDHVGDHSFASKQFDMLYDQLKDHLEENGFSDLGSADAYIKVQ